MIKAPIPADEQERQKDLLELRILDTEPEERFDRITRTAQALFGVRISYIALLEGNRQWFKSACGLSTPETPRDISFCGHAIMEDRLLVVPDAFEDKRFHDNPLVRGEPFVRFYAGRPLRSYRGHKVGTLCVADTRPRTLDEKEIRLLEDLATMVEDQFNLVEVSELQVKLRRAHEDLRRSNDFIRQVFGRYAGDALVSRILEEPGTVHLGGERRTISILVSDLRGFTSLSTRVPPDKLVDILNVYFETMIEKVEEHGGIILDFAGDGMFVAFGALPPYEDHSTRALDCAIAMQEGMQRLHEEVTAVREHNLRMGIGINTGDAVVGNVGSHRRMKFGAVGAQVNLAARIEGFSVGGQILVSTSTLEMASRHFQTEGKLRVKMKGIDTPFTIHELSSPADLS
jgi:adenylate cyclase